MRRDEDGAGKNVGSADVPPFICCARRAHTRSRSGGGGPGRSSSPHRSGGRNVTTVSVIVKRSEQV